jgi:hypothetical protein
LSGTPWCGLRHCCPPSLLNCPAIYYSRCPIARGRKTCGVTTKKGLPCASSIKERGFLSTHTMVEFSRHAIIGTGGEKWSYIYVIMRLRVKGGTHGVVKQVGIKATIPLGGHPTGVVMQQPPPHPRIHFPSQSHMSVPSPSIGSGVPHGMPSCAPPLEMHFSTGAMGHSSAVATAQHKMAAASQGVPSSLPHHTQPPTQMQTQPDVQQQHQAHGKGRSLYLGPGESCGPDTYPVMPNPFTQHVYCYPTGVPRLPIY